MELCWIHSSNGTSMKRTKWLGYRDMWIKEELPNSGLLSTPQMKHYVLLRWKRQSLFNLLKKSRNNQNQHQNLNQNQSLSQHQNPSQHLSQNQHQSLQSHKRNLLKKRTNKKKMLKTKQWKKLQQAQLQLNKLNSREVEPMLLYHLVQWPSSCFWLPLSDASHRQLQGQKDEQNSTYSLIWSDLVAQASDHIKAWHKDKLKNDIYNK